MGYPSTSNMRPRATLATYRCRAAARRRWYSDDSYMKRRLEQLAEDAAPLADDPKAGGRAGNELIEEMYRRIEKADSGGKISTRGLNVLHTPKAAPKSAVETAQGVAWTGEESVEAMAKRMAIDKMHRKGIKLPTFSKVTNSQRLSRARDKSLDYQISNKQDTGPSIGDMYREKFMMATSGSNTASGTIAAITSVANQHIEDAIKRGQFENLPRGQKLEKDHHTSSPYIDTTEYFLNRMIQRQGATPPWIEQQKKMHGEIDKLRKRLKTHRTERAIAVLDSTTRNLSKRERLKAAHRVAHARDYEWEESQLVYHTLQVKRVNDIIRSYNLQAPGSARTGYLELEEELQLARVESAKDVPLKFQHHIDAPPPPPKIENIQTKARHELVSENPENYYGMMDLFRDLLKRKIPK